MIDTEQAKHIYLHSLLSSLLLQEQMDLLQGTSAYRHELKLAAKRLAKELEKIINDDVPLVWGINDPVMFAQMDYQKDLIGKIAGNRADENGIIGKMIDRYRENPEAVCAALQIQITQPV